MTPRKCDKNRFTSTNLTSDIFGVAPNLDAALVNPWGALIEHSTIWVADNGTGVLTNYKKDGSIISNNIVNVLSDGGNNGNPTGLVRNHGSGFKITKKGVVRPSKFIVVTENGTINGYNPEVDPKNAIVVLSFPG